jgi:tRNA threonylcarbamoyladenosine biosynthesis protein TsaE
MRKIIEYSKNIKDTRALAKKIARIIKPPCLIGLIGELGSGKTFFTQELARALNVKDYVTSPTFTYLNIYDSKYKLYHFDLYRIKKYDEFINLGLADVLYKNEISVIEWFDKIEKEIKDIDIKIIFTIISEQERKIELNLSKKYEACYVLSNNKTKKIKN